MLLLSDLLKECRFENNDWICNWSGDVTFKHSCVDLLGNFFKYHHLHFNSSDTVCDVTQFFFPEVHLLLYKCMLMIQMSLGGMSNSNCHVTVILIKWWPMFHNITLWLDSNVGLHRCHNIVVWFDFNVGTNIYTKLWQCCQRIVVWSDFKLWYQNCDKIVAMSPQCQMPMFDINVDATMW